MQCALPQVEELMKSFYQSEVVNADECGFLSNGTGFKNYPNMNPGS